VGIFKSRAVARAVKKQFGGKQRNNRVCLSFYEDATREAYAPLVEDMRKYADEQNVNVHEYYQDVQITVFLPRETTPAQAQLLLSESDAAILRELFKLCNAPTITNTKTGTKLTFAYAGDMIVNPAGKRFFVGCAVVEGSEIFKIKSRFING
jgi:hypothetical protein